MVFSSIEFLFLFLPAVVAGYYLLPRCARNVWLLLASLVFYAWGEPFFVLVMMMSIAFNFVFALGIVRFRSQGRAGWSRGMLVLAILGNLALLGGYKYLNFVTGTLRAWFPALQGAIPQTSILLPIGISFFTFQAMSYVIDVHRGEEVQRNPARLALYIALFPQLVAGPIIRYRSIVRQLVERRETWSDFCEGLYRFAVGLNKKVLLANVFAEMADRGFPVGAAPDVGTAWTAAIAFSLQVYFDFGGYSDMAIGLGRMFGFSFPENFSYPYLSGSITEFWRRWHLSLSAWFRDYVYFPLGGSRVGRIRLCFNIMAVWTLVGLWHGANWTFVVWGLAYGILLLGEKLTDIERRRAASLGLRTGYRLFALLAIAVLSPLVRADDLCQYGRLVSGLVGTGGDFAVDVLAYRLKEDGLLLAVGFVASTPVFRLLGTRLSERWPNVVCSGGCLVQGALFVFSTASLVMSDYNPFLYFNF